jgi:hypothetical protein
MSSGFGRPILPMPVAASAVRPQFGHFAAGVRDVIPAVLKVYLPSRQKVSLRRARFLF